MAASKPGNFFVIVCLFVILQFEEAIFFPPIFHGFLEIIINVNYEDGGQPPEFTLRVDHKNLQV